MPSRIATFMNERKVKTQATVLADEYVLIHESTFSDMLQSDSNSRVPHSSRVDGGLESSLSSLVEHQSWNKPDPNSICNYCKNQGHWKKECPALEAKLANPFEYL